MNFEPQENLSKGQILQFDYQASTPCSIEVVDAMSPYWSKFWGNPSSRQNRLGLNASAAVALAREQIAEFLGIASKELIFTSGATEANNLALIGHSRAMAIKKGKPGHIITLATEHHAVLDPLRQLKREGFSLTEISPNHDGLISKDQLNKYLQEDTFLVSIMLANNEIGVIQPVKDLAELCKERGVIMHTDAAQAFGHLLLDLNNICLDLVSISGHKIYGPKGIGALICRRNTPLLPLQWGGGQEDSLRPGTIPVPLVIGFAKAAEIAFRDLSENQIRLASLRDKLWSDLKTRVPNLILNGSIENRLPHNLNFTILGVNGNLLYKELRSLVACSSGSACSKGSPSHVLLALGRNKIEAEASIRLSIGRKTTLSEVNKVVDLLQKVICKLRGGNFNR